MNVGARRMTAVNADEAAFETLFSAEYGRVVGDRVVAILAVGAAVEVRRIRGGARFGVVDHPPQGSVS